MNATTLTTHVGSSARSRRYVSVVAVVAISASALFATTPANAAPRGAAAPTSAEYRMTPPSVPIVDSQLGHGTALAAGVPTEITVPNLVDAPQSALVRISAFTPAASAEITVAGAPALSVAAGASASTTVLVALSPNGTFPLQASADVNVRVESIATFAGAAAAPGSFTALEQPVNRTDAAGGTAAPLTSVPLTAVGTPVGVVGLGGVPAVDVRAVFATATIAVATPTTVHLGDLDVPVAAGTTSISTILSPSAAGDVLISADDSDAVDAAASVRVDVRGWVSDLGQSELGDETLANVTGSFVPAVDAAATSATITDTTSLPLPATSLAETDIDVVLVWGDDAERTTTLAPGASTPGRSAGALVDAQSGLQPQLLLVPSDDAQLSLKRGSLDAGLVVLGGFLGAQTAPASELGVTVDSHKTGDTIDLAEVGGTISLAGIVQVQAGNTASVTVKSGGTLIGSAAVRQTPAGTSWALETAVPTSGEHEFTVTVTDRSGRTRATAITLTVTLPGADETVIVDNVQVIEDTAEHSVAGITDDTVELFCDLEVGPGDYLVASALPNAPNGFLRQVVAVDVTPTSTLVHTVPALLTDLVLQASVDETNDLGAGDAATVISVPTTAEEAGVDEILEGDETPVWMGDESVDTAGLTEFDGEGEIIAAPVSGSVEPAPAAGVESQRLNAGARSVGGEISTSKTMSSAIKIGYLKESGSTTDASKTDGKSTKSKVKVEGGFYLEASQSTTAKLLIKADVWVTWSWAIPKPHLDIETSFTLSSEVKTKIEAYLKASASQPSKGIDKPVAKYYFPGITVYLGIPVYVSPSVDLSLTGSVSATASLSFEMTETISKKIGVVCNDGTCSKIDTTPAGSKTAKPVVASNDAKVSGGGELDASFGPKFSASALLYGVAGPEIALGVKVGGKLSVTGTSDGTFTAAAELYVKATAGLSLVVEIPVFNITVLEWTVGEIEQKWVLANLSLTFGEAPPDGPDPGSSGSSGPKPTPGGGDDGGPTRDAIDMMIVIDTTGSMGSYIADAISNAKGIIAKLDGTARSARVGLVEYRDYGDEYIARTVQPLTEDLGSLNGALDALWVGGGGDWEEAVYSGVVTALVQDWRPTAARAMVVMGDAPAHDPEVHTGYTGAQVAGFLTGSSPICQNGDGDIIGGPALPTCAAGFAGADAVGGASDGTDAFTGESRMAVRGIGDEALLADAPAVSLPVSLYGVSSDSWLTEQLTALADATGGTVASVDGADGVGDAIIEAIEDAGSAPSPHFEWAGPVVTGAEVVLDASASLFEGEAATFSVDFGDGTPVQVSGEPVLTHSYAAPGTYTVVVTVTDARGRAAQASAVLTVVDTELEWMILSDIVVDPAAAASGDVVTVTAGGLVPGDVVSFSWAGDGAFATAVVNADGVVAWPVVVPAAEIGAPLGFAVTAPQSRQRGSGSISVVAPVVGCPV